MTVYQIHEYTGEYEDFVDRIVATYLDPDKAQDDMYKRRKAVEDLDKASAKCACCPTRTLSCEDVTEDLLKDIKRYCSKFEKIEQDDELDCKNFFEVWDIPSYKIRAEEVIDG